LTEHDLLTKKPAWLSTEITYGLYLSDHSILDAVDTELVVLGGIMMQNLPRETGWHLRGTRRIGVSFEDVEVVQQCVSFPFILYFSYLSSFFAIGIFSTGLERRD
jgi:hypothetical protein